MLSLHILPKALIIVSNFCQFYLPKFFLLKTAPVVQILFDIAVLMSGRVAAQNLVEDIVKDHGYIRASTINGVGKMSQEWRREIEDAILKKDQLIGANIITYAFYHRSSQHWLTIHRLARNLYSSNARFVFELLQNADDNHFSKAFGSNQLPFVSFDLHLNQRRIVVECNEDGFTKANLVAISNLGQSSKSGAQAYIGEKGIGFKSIFKVAYKVLIQSGDFKFSFNHKKGDSGMGMICPEWEPDVPFLDSGSTRMTLFLHEDDQDGNQAQDIRDQFKDLHPEMLLFLKNLRRIVVRIFDEEDDPEATTTYRVLSASDNRMETETVTEKGGNTESERKYFHVTKYMATDLPRGETRNYAQAEVVVAFPLSVNSVPLEEDQSVFAFLPLCEAGFNVRIPFHYCFASATYTIHSSFSMPILLPLPTDRTLRQLRQGTRSSSRVSLTPS